MSMSEGATRIMMVGKAIILIGGLACSPVSFSLTEYW